MTPLFSICHTTARPNGWQDSYRAWMDNIEWGPNVEYVLCMDERWGFTEKDQQLADEQGIVTTWNHGRKCMVDGYKYAAAASTGMVLILNSDDMRPCPNWDAELDSVINDRYEEDFVIEVKSGTPVDERGLMVLQIMSRTRYERLGYAMYPGYESLYADDDFGDHARRDQVVLDGRHLTFPHLHFTFGTNEIDDVYKHQNRATSLMLGQQTYARRKREGFVS